MAETDATEKQLDQTTDSKAGDSAVARDQAQTGMKDLSQDTRDYYQARKSGMRDKHTSEILGAQPQFFDSAKDQTGTSKDQVNSKQGDNSQIANAAKPGDNAQATDASKQGGPGQAGDAKSSESGKPADYGAKPGDAAPQKDPSAEEKTGFKAEDVAAENRAKLPGDSGDGGKQGDKAKEGDGSKDGDKAKAEKSPEAAAQESKEHLQKNVEQLDKYKQQEMNKNLNDFENRKPPVSPEQKKEFYDQVSNLLEAKDNPSLRHPNKEERSQLALDVTENAAHPERVNQGQHDTCGAASLESRMYTTNPGDAARVVNEAATTGWVTPKGMEEHAHVPGSSLPGSSYPVHDSVLRPPPDGGSDGRNYASQVFQGAANSMEPGGAGYRQDKAVAGKTPPDTGERIVDAAGQKQRFNGLSSEEVMDAERKVTGNDAKKVLESADLHDPGQTAGPEYARSAQHLKDTLAGHADRHDFPIPAVVNNGRPPFNLENGNGKLGGGTSTHFVNITGYDKQTGTITYTNQYGGDAKTVSADEFYGGMDQGDPSDDPSPAKRRRQ